jgi:hypothetical protein
MEIVLLALAAAFLSGLPIAWFVIRTYRLYRGMRVVTCPETRAPAAVKLDAGRAAVTGLTGNVVEFRLKSCSRWPQRQQCGQECLSQIQAAPEKCRVESARAKALRDARCAICGLDLGTIGRSASNLVLMSPDRRRRLEWDEVRPEELPRVLSTYSPICWNCHMEESLRTLRPQVARRSRAS